MKASELQGNTVDQLTEKLAGFKREALNLRFQKVTGELENVSRIKVVRRSIARIKTLLRSKDSGGDNA